VTYKKVFIELTPGDEVSVADEKLNDMDMTGDCCCQKWSHAWKTIFLLKYIFKFARNGSEFQSNQGSERPKRSQGLYS
jgi:hypothetical protein